jgi:murein DD-endopeptidase MepM/ murein hydrolase activator NlpD
MRLRLISTLLALVAAALPGAETLHLDSDALAAAELAGRPLVRISDGARYLRDGGAIQPERGLFVYFRAGGLPLRPDISHPTTAIRGEAVSGLVSTQRPLQTLDVALLGPGGRGRALVSARGLRLPGEPVASSKRGEQWAFLLGLPSTLEAGLYTLQVSGTAAEGLFIYLAEITVHHRSFRMESISFDQALSSLMTSPSALREREAAELLEVLATFRGSAVFHTAALALPVQGARRTSLYADRRLYRYVDGGSSRSLHNGVDLACPEGTPVTAAGSGRVVLAGSRLMTGNSVVLEHLPGVYSLYYHLRDVEVQEGDLVAQGACIGTVGSTGLATGPHLHWELRVAGVAVDPEIFLDRPLIDKTSDSGTLIENAVLEMGRR